MVITSVDTRPASRPPLKWAGGKRWLVPHLRHLWAQHRGRRLVEPLCGGLAVTLGLAPERALLNDINPHLVNFYSWLRQGLVVEIPLENTAERFYTHRSRFNYLIATDASASKEAAELFYYLNRTGFNGLCRFNNKGEFNVPFGTFRRINYTRDFTPYVEVFANWQFSAGSYDRIALAPDDFVYADPPYDVEFTKYAKENFGWEDQVRLARWLAEHPGPVVLSNQATARVIQLYDDLGFVTRVLSAPRRISCTGDRTPADEVLAVKGL